MSKVGVHVVFCRAHVSASVILRAGPKKVFLMIRNLFSGGGGGDIVAQVERGREGGEREMKGKAAAAAAARSQIMPPFVATARGFQQRKKRAKERKNERRKCGGRARPGKRIEKSKKWICRRHRKEGSGRRIAQGGRHLFADHFFSPGLCLATALSLLLSL